MLNQLIESKNNGRESRRKSRLFLATLAALAALLTGSWTVSLFAKDYRMAGGDLDMARLVAPIAVEREAPPPRPEPAADRPRSSGQRADKIVLRELYEELSRPQTPPKDTSGQKEAISARRFNLEEVEPGDFDRIPGGAGRRGSESTNGPDNCGLCRETDGQKAADKGDGELPKVVKAAPQESVKNRLPKSLGVINSIATNLVRPPYPAPARAVRAEGAVSVQVLIDEEGKVVSATAVSGHPLLRRAAVEAAQRSRFTPTLLSNQPIKVTGVIVYDFKVQ